MPLLTDDDLDRLVEQFVEAARLAWTAGYAFVDVKACHGYLGHELLSARDRPGRYGGSLDNRTRFLRSIIEGIRATSPGLVVGVRLSAFDTVPYRKDARGIGEPETHDAAYRSAFGLLHRDMDDALTDARQLLGTLERLGIRWICVTAGSPYYNPHVQRPALFPPLDGYLPPEDPLAGVARQIDATARLKAACPSLVFVGSGYTYLAGMAAARRGARRARRPDRLRRPRPDGALVSGSAGRRPVRRAAEAESDLPDLQRLHDRAAHGAGVGLLPAGRPLLVASRRRAAEGVQSALTGRRA